MKWLVPLSTIEFVVYSHVDCHKCHKLLHSNIDHCRSKTLSLTGKTFELTHQITKTSSFHSFVFDFVGLSCLQRAPNELDIHAMDDINFHYILIYIVHCPSIRWKLQLLFVISPNFFSLFLDIYCYSYCYYYIMFAFRSSRSADVDAIVPSSMKHFYFFLHIWLLNSQVIIKIFFLFICFNGTLFFHLLAKRSRPTHRCSVQTKPLISSLMLSENVGVRRLSPFIYICPVIRLISNSFYSWCSKCGIYIWIIEETKIYIHYH